MATFLATSPHCDSKEISYSEFVKHAAAFFGPGEHWREPWNEFMPNAKPSKESANRI